MAAVKTFILCIFTMICLARNSSNIDYLEILVFQRLHLSFYLILGNSDITSLNIVFVSFKKLFCLVSV